MLVGLRRSITLSFMIAGHTKFAPDVDFGLIKHKNQKKQKMLNAYKTLFKWLTDQWHSTKQDFWEHRIYKHWFQPMSVSPILVNISMRCQTSSSTIRFTLLLRNQDGSHSRNSVFLNNWRLISGRMIFLGANHLMTLKSYSV